MSPCSSPIFGVSHRLVKERIPRDLFDLLNIYLTEVATIIETQRELWTSSSVMW